MAPFSIGLNSGQSDVTNSDRSTHYVAVILDNHSGINKFGISTDSSMIEKAIKERLDTF